MRLNKLELSFVKSDKTRLFFCSWSGGKDSCLALYRAMQNNGTPRILLTMLTEDGLRSHSHGLQVHLLQRQAKSLGIPLVTRNASWNDYEENFVHVIRSFKEQGIGWGVFGDIDLEDHLVWVERVCSSVGIQPCEPLWKASRRELLDEFLSMGFRATIVAVKLDVLNGSFLGRELDLRCIAELEAAGIDISGEEGEYHTVVTDGPIFNVPIRIQVGKTESRDGYCFAEVQCS